MRGTLAVDVAAPVGLTEVTLSFEIDSQADAKKLEKLVQLTERYCLIYQTLSHSPKLSVNYRATPQGQHGNSGDHIEYQQ